MHDVLEGLVPCFIQNLIKYCGEKKIASFSTVQTLIRDFNYGFLFKGKLPSKASNTENATQLRTIMIHLPFILKDFRDSIEDVTGCMTSLLQIMQILFSTTISESDLRRLEALVETHLRSYQRIFKALLTPKHHFSTHYADIIRKLGPVLSASMMRYEAKHKVLASLGKTECFKNIALTIAERHQMMMCKNQFEPRKIKESKRTVFQNCSKYLHCINDRGYNLEKLFSLKFMNYSHFQYRKGLFLIDKFVVHEILQILVHENSYAFICKNYETVRIDSFFNSIQNSPKNDDNIVMIFFVDLENKQSYQKTVAFGNSYIIADTLKVYRPE